MKRKRDTELEEPSSKKSKLDQPSPSRSESSGREDEVDLDTSRGMGKNNRKKTFIKYNENLYIRNNLNGTFSIKNMDHVIKTYMLENCQDQWIPKNVVIDGICNKNNINNEKSNYFKTRSVNMAFSSLVEKFILYKKGDLYLIDNGKYTDWGKQHRELTIENDKLQKRLNELNQTLKKNVI